MCQHVWIAQRFRALAHVQNSLKIHTTWRSWTNFNNVKTIWQVVQSFSASATKTTNHQSDSKSCAPHATPSISQHTTAGTMSGSKHDKDESAGMNQVRWVPRVQAGACDGAHRRHGQPQHRASFVQVSKIVEEKQLNQERVQEVRVP